MFNVLIVEDDPMVAMINEQYVCRHKSFNVVGKCNNGDKALKFLSENTVDLIILDVFMPQKDGFETLRQLRKEKCSVDVIMVTAANDRESLEEGLHLGVIDYLVKPFTFDRFRLALDKFISQKQILKDFDTLDQSNIDFIIDKEKGPMVIEINTLPGMTEMSLFPDSARYAGISFSELCESIIAYALEKK